MLVVPFIISIVIAVVLKLDEDRSGEYNAKALCLSYIACWGTYIGIALVDILGSYIGWWV